MKLTEEQEFSMKLAKKLYESYCAYTGNKSAVTGDNLPLWENLPGAVKNAWFASAEGGISFLASQTLVKEYVTCADCGNKIKSDSKYCPHCP